MVISNSPISNLISNLQSPMSKTVLVVDDEERLVSLVKTYLTQEGFRVVTAPNGREALFLARQEKPDLIVLDLMMPEMDGYEFMRLHRKERETPIILLTARVEDSDKVLGLELGADDYVTKPFSPRELTARVRAVLRRSGQAAPPADVLRAADIVLDRSAHIVKVGDRPVDLTPSEFDLLVGWSLNSATNDLSGLPGCDRVTHPWKHRAGDELWVAESPTSLS